MSEYIDKSALTNKLKSSGAIGDFALYILGNFPAADVAPVVHGHWIRFKETDPETGYIHMRCSVCSAYWSDPSHADHFRYCPNCGAKMDGKERQNNE